MPRRVTKDVDEFLRRINLNKTQRSVNLSAWKIGLFQWGKVCRALKGNSSMKFLEVTGDGAYFHRLRLTQCRSLGGTISANTALVQITISGKSIGDAGAIAIARGLKRNKTLVALDLSQNGITRAGVTQIATILRFQSSLQSLSLAGNDLADKRTMRAFIKALGPDASLTSVDLSSASIDDHTLRVLAAALLENRSLTDLKLTNNPLTGRGALMLADASLRNPVWARLQLSSSYLDLTHLKGPGARTDGEAFVPDGRSVIRKKKVPPGVATALGADGDGATGGGEAEGDGDRKGGGRKVSDAGSAGKSSDAGSGTGPQSARGESNGADGALESTHATTGNTPVPRAASIASIEAEEPSPEEMLREEVLLRSRPARKVVPAEPTREEMERRMEATLMVDQRPLDASMAADRASEPAVSAEWDERLPGLSSWSFLGGVVVGAAPTSSDPDEDGVQPAINGFVTAAGTVKLVRPGHTAMLLSGDGRGESGLGAPAGASSGLPRSGHRPGSREGGASESKGKGGGGGGGGIFESDSPSATQAAARAAAAGIAVYGPDGELVDGAVPTSIDLNEVPVSASAAAAARRASAQYDAAEIEEDAMWIDLSEKNLSVEDIVVVGRLIWANTAATALDLSLNAIAGPKGDRLDGVLSLCEAIKANTTLNMLDLQETGLGGEAASRIAAATLHSESIELIRFDEAELPVQVITGRQPQSELDLRTPDLSALVTDEDGNPVVASSVGGDDVSTAPTSVGGDTSAMGGSSGMSGTAMPASSRSAADSSRLSAVLDSIRTGGSAAGSVDLEALAKLPLSDRESTFVGEVLRRADNRTLVKLDGVELGTASHVRYFYDELLYHQIVMISLQMRGMTTLENLDLSSHNIGPRGAKVLAASLAYNMSVNTLAVHNTAVKSAGAAAIATCLRRQRLKTLTDLDISWCQIGDVGAVALAHVLADKPEFSSVEAAKKSLAAATAKAESTKVKEVVKDSKPVRSFLGIKDEPEDKTKRKGLAGAAARALAADKEGDGDSEGGGKAEAADDDDAGAAESKGGNGADGDAEAKDGGDGVAKSLAAAATEAGAAAALTGDAAADVPADAGVAGVDEDARRGSGFGTETEEDTEGSGDDTDIDMAELRKNAWPGQKVATPQRSPSMRFFGSAVTKALAATIRKNKVEIEDKIKMQDPLDPDAPGAEDEVDKGSELPESEGVLKTLQVRGNEIGVLGIYSLSRALKTCSSLVTLSLSFNSMSDTSVTHLAGALRRNRVLRALELDSCDITANGAVILAVALRTCSLERLSIAGDPFCLPLRLLEGVGVAAIARAMMNDTCHINNLRLNDCSPGLPGVRALGQMLMANSRLTYLDLSCTLRHVVLPKETGEYNAPDLTALREMNLEKGERKTLEKAPVASLKRICEETGIDWRGIDRRAWEKIFTKLPASTAPTTPATATVRATSSTAANPGSPKGRSSVGGAGESKSGGALGGAAAAAHADEDDEERTDIFIDSDGDEIDLAYADVDYDLQMETVDFRVTNAEEKMWGIADRTRDDHKGQFGVTQGGAQVGGGYKDSEEDPGGIAVGKGRSTVVEVDPESAYGGFTKMDVVEAGHFRKSFAMGTELSFLLARGLAKNRSLKLLGLRGNHIGIDGVGALGRVLDANRTLQESLEVLDLGKNSIDKKAALKIVARLKGVGTFKHVDLRDNHLDNEVVKRELRKAGGEFMAVHL